MLINKGRARWATGLLLLSALPLMMGCVGPFAKQKSERAPKASVSAAADGHGDDVKVASAAGLDSHGAPVKDAHGAPVAGAAKDAHAAPHWDYTGKLGQNNWASLSSEYAACADGAQQSPIDIADAQLTALKDIEFKYKPAAVSVVNNGHTLQVNYGDGVDGGSMLVDGVEYKLLQFHFHRPSEHTVNGKQYAMELHLVHKDAKGALAVLGVLMDTGAENAAYGPIAVAIPQKEGTTAKVDGTLDIMSLLPKQYETFRYAGSLTTPPCSEGVKWHVLKAPVQVSREQVAQFRGVYPFTSRNVQPLYGRDVWEDAGPDR